MALGWKLHGDGKTMGPDDVVAPDERLSWGKTIGLGAQHVVAMFGATFVFPLVMGLNPQLAIMMSGIATICFLLIMIASCGLRPMTSGKTKVAPNIATTCWAPRPTVLPHDSRSSGATTSSGPKVLPSP